MGSFSTSHNDGFSMRWLLPPTVVFIVYSFAFAVMFRHSSICYLFSDPSTPQPFLAYGYHPDPDTNNALDSLFRPFTIGLKPDEMILDPGDFSGAKGWRLGWRMPLLLWQSTSGKILLVALIASIGVVGGYAFPYLIRMVRWGVARGRLKRPASTQSTKVAFRPFELD